MFKRLRNERARKAAEPGDRWRFDPISVGQIAFIQSLMTDWDAVTHREVTAAEHQGALRLLGLPDYTKQTLSRLTKGEASDVIERLKGYDP